MRISYKYCTQYMCILYIVPNIIIWYNAPRWNGVIYMTVSKAQQKAVAKYTKENYDEIKLRVSKGRKAEIKAHAEAQGMSMNEFIRKVIDAALAK